MLITKIFNVESAHIVRNCTSERCSHSIHGHSAKIEITFQATNLDNAQMVMDFGLMKDEIKKFVDSMDHCYLLCDKDNSEFKKMIKKECDRWIEMSFNPSAEMLSMFVFYGVQKILDHMKFNNGESGSILVHSVKYHETATGSATCDATDVNNLFNDKLFKFSSGIINEWQSKELEDIFVRECDCVIENPIIKQQINLKY